LNDTARIALPVLVYFTTTFNNSIKQPTPARRSASAIQTQTARRSVTSRIIISGKELRIRAEGDLSPFSRNKDTPIAMMRSARRDSCRTGTEACKFRRDSNAMPVAAPASRSGGRVKHEITENGSENA
jgi:hypothetical protein